MIDPSRVFTEEQKNAIAVLLAAGFAAFADARLDDVRELDTGRRRRTFRNQGRYAMVLALRKPPEAPAPAAAPKSVAAIPKPVAAMTKAELVAEALDAGLPGAAQLNKPELAQAVQAGRDRRALLLKHHEI
jgi:hypothetical protein